MFSNLIRHYRSKFRAVKLANVGLKKVFNKRVPLMSGIGEGKRTRTQLLEVKVLFIYKNKQTNKHPVGEKQTGWLDKTQTTSNIRYEPIRNCKHKEILKGANDEGNGKQLGKINQ